MTWPRVRGLFVFAAARGDLRPEPGLGHCFLGPAALPASAVLGCRPFPPCLGLSDGGECGGSGEDPGASSSSSSSWERTLLQGMGARGVWGWVAARSPGVTEMGLPMEQAWEYEDPPLDTQQWMARTSFLVDPSISDQIFSSSTLLSLDTCPTFPGPKKPWLCSLRFKQTPCLVLLPI